MSFCTAINCMDGRVQIPAIEYLQNYFGVEYVDTITEAGPVKILASQENEKQLNSIINRIDISTKKHNSTGIAIIAHYDCAGNPLEKNEQCNQLETAAKLLSIKYPSLEILGLWIDSGWSVEKILSIRHN